MMVEDCHHSVSTLYLVTGMKKGFGGVIPSQSKLF